jgi:hypothetical protein
LAAFDTAITDLATTTLTGTVEANTANVAIDDKTVNDIINQAATVSETIDGITSQIDNSSVEQRIEKKVVLDINTDSNINTL